MSFRICIVTVILGLCGSESPANQQGSNDDGDQTTRPTVRLGYIGNLSGSNSNQGESGKLAAELAIAEANKADDGLYRFELVAKDDQCDRIAGSIAASQICGDRHVVAAVTHYCSVAALGAVDLYHLFELPVIVWGAVRTEITHGNTFREIHRINGNMRDQNRTAAEKLLTKNLKRWVIVYEDNAYGKGHSDAFRKAMNDLGKSESIIEVITVSQGDHDFKNEIRRIVNGDADVVYFAGQTEGAVEFLEDLREEDDSILFHGCSGIVGNTFIDELGETAEGVVAFRGGVNTKNMAGGSDFLTLYEATFNKPPDQYAIFSYAATNLLIEAVNEVGPNRRRIRSWLNQVDGVPTAVGSVEFDKSGQNKRVPISPLIVEDGAWVHWESSKTSKFRDK
ncbi:MAG: branched-chain amino acid ABC transporter substrate-binding protein [Verrucomicrobiota bacterium]